MNAVKVRYNDSDVVKSINDYIVRYNNHPGVVERYLGFPNHIVLSKEIELKSANALYIHHDPFVMMHHIIPMSEGSRANPHFVFIGGKHDIGFLEKILEIDPGEKIE